MTTFTAYVVYARAEQEALSYAPDDARDRLSEGMVEVGGYTYALQEVSGVWELRITPVSGRPMEKTDLWALEGAHDFIGYAFKVKPVGCSDAALQERVDQVAEDGLHWNVALR